jgi:hypothetical protein
MVSELDGFYHRRTAAAVEGWGGVGWREVCKVIR